VTNRMGELLRALLDSFWFYLVPKFVSWICFVRKELPRVGALTATRFRSDALGPRSTTVKTCVNVGAAGDTGVERDAGFCADSDLDSYSSRFGHD
jgi:hypothetical protein